MDVLGGEDLPPPFALKQQSNADYDDSILGVEDVALSHDSSSDPWTQTSILENILRDTSEDASKPKIIDQDLEAQDAELRALGISVVDQVSLERDVEAAVDKAVTVHARKQRMQMLKREIQDVKKEIKQGDLKLGILSERLSGMQRRVVDPRQYFNVEKELKNKNEQLKGLKSREDYLKQKLQAAETNEAELDDFELEDGEIMEEEEDIACEEPPERDRPQLSEKEREKLIREGKMTPFGTVMTSSTSKTISVTRPVVSKFEKQKLQAAVKEKERVRENLINTGEMTPFGSVVKTTKKVKSKEKEKKSTTVMTDFEKYLQDQIDRQKMHSDNTGGMKRKKSSGDPNYGRAKRKKKPREYIGKSYLSDGDKSEDDGTSLSSIKNKVKSGYEAKINKVKSSELKRRPRSKDPIKMKVLHPKHKKPKKVALGSVTSELERDQYKETPRRILSERMSFEGGESGSEVSGEDSGSEYIPSDEEAMANDSGKWDDVDDDDLENRVCGNVDKIDRPKRQRKKRVETDDEFSADEIPKTKGRRSLKEIDDGNIDDYVRRIEQWKESRLKEKHAKILRGEDLDSEEEEEGYEEFDGGYKIPLAIWNKLYKYQRTCVKWLWELHTQGCGGILGDEMGLGKTIQIISFLVGLSYSRLRERQLHWKGLGPVLIVCPATVLHQWVKEFHKWWPPFRVAILHESGSYVGKRSSLIHNINKYDGILITSYTGVHSQIDILLQYKWHYIILDEGHKIRNPEAQITVALKRFQTPHRLILSGSPIQNSLKELWSLFDFVFPGKLGTLPVFMAEFAVPITHGGYANASKLEVQTAFKCASVLRDTINPYLLRRMKNDVRNHLSLPDKNEQVLFCSLTEEQRSAYRNYLSGDQVKWIVGGRMKVFVGLITLRKICNHPDMFTGGPHTYDGYESGLQPELKYGWWGRSGKMHVLQSILRLWSKQGHRVLLFTQSRQMMCILEKFLIDENYSYLKMDGTTSVSSRQPLIEKFNTNPDYFVFLLTTRVGGLGVNLTGADRVVIFDPDWNPSTDCQARERAWRIGQMRHVTIYRLLTSGTIEEKIYHRQIFKQFLTNRVLKDPKQQRFFKTNDLYELFTLNEGVKEKTESSAIFAGTGSEIKVDVDKDGKESDEETPQKPKKPDERARGADFGSKNKYSRKSSSKVSIEKESTGKSKKMHKSESRETKNRHSHKSSSQKNENSSIKSQVNLKLQERMRNLAKQISMNIAKKSSPLSENQQNAVNTSTSNLETVSGTNDSASCVEKTTISIKQEKSDDQVLLVKLSDIKQEESNGKVNEEGKLNMINRCDDQQCNYYDLSLKNYDNLATIKTDPGSGDETPSLENPLGFPTHDIRADFDGKKSYSEMESDVVKEEWPVENGEFQASEAGNACGISRQKKGSASENDSDSGNCSLSPKEVDDSKITHLEKHKKKHKKKDKHRDKKDKHRDKNSHKKGKKIDGERIDYLVKKRVYRKTEEEEKAEKEDAKSQDEYVLAKLFQKSGVHTALSHDSILSNNDPDYLLMEGEADRVAKEALKAVRASRARCLRPWMASEGESSESKKKHKFGNKKNKIFSDSVDREIKDQAKKPKKVKERMFNGGLDDDDSDSTSELNFFPKKAKKSQDGLSSAQLLSRIHQRNKTVASMQLTDDVNDDDEDYDPDYPSTARPTEAEEPVDEEVQDNIDLLTDIRNFVAFQAEVDGSASTKEIIDRFRTRLPPEQTPFFKALLTKICDFHRKTSGEGIWSLKEEFR